MAVEYTDCISAERKTYPTGYPGYDIKQSDGEATVMKEIWGMWSIPSFPSLLGPHWPEVGAPDRVLSMAKIERFDIS